MPFALARRSSVASAPTFPSSEKPSGAFRIVDCFFEKSVHLHIRNVRIASTQKHQHKLNDPKQGGEALLFNFASDQARPCHQRPKFARENDVNISIK